MPRVFVRNMMRMAEKYAVFAASRRRKPRNEIRQSVNS
jgi:hypothetical protein